MPGTAHRDPQAQLAQASLWVNTDGSLLSWAPAGVLLADGNARFPECPDLFPLSPLGDVDGDLAPEAQQYYVLLASETYRRGTRWYLGTLHPTNASVNSSAKNGSIGAGGFSASRRIGQGGAGTVFLADALPSLPETRRYFKMLDQQYLEAKARGLQAYLQATAALARPRLQFGESVHVLEELRDLLHAFLSGQPL